MTLRWAPTWRKLILQRHVKMIYEEMLEKDMLDREITHFFVFQFRPVLKNVKCKWFRSITNSTLNTLVLEYLIWFGSCEEACGVFVIDNYRALFTWLVASWLLPRLLATSWLVSSIGRALHRYHRGHGFKSRTGLKFFSGPIYNYSFQIISLPDKQHEQAAVIESNL